MEDQRITPSSTDTDENYQPFRPLPPTRRLTPEPSFLAPMPAPRETRRRAKRGRTRLESFLLFVFVVVAIVGAGILANQLYFADRIVPGVRVLGQDLGGLTRAQAEVVIQEGLSSPSALLARFGVEPLVLRDGSRVFRATPQELGFQTDPQPVLYAAYGVAHRGDLWLDLAEQVRALMLGADVSANVIFNEERARDYLLSLQPQIDRPARDASFRFEGLRVVDVPPQKGRALDVDACLEHIRTRLLDPASGDISLVVKDVEPKTIDTSTARTQIENFLRAPLILTYAERQWAIDQATLASMITLQPVTNPDGTARLLATLNRDALTEKVQALAREINQPARDARFQFNGGNLTPTVTSQEGRTLDVDATVKGVEQRLKQTALGRINGYASPNDLTPIQALRENTVELNVQVSKPAVDMRDASKMGIKELVSQGVSKFAHSIPSRITNINVATAQFNGVVIPPGATFSFISYLNQIVEANGYEDAYVIFGNKTILGPGGGVCQVSTTAFRAAFFGGFPIVERHPHAYRVAYYEPPVGLDASVFVPTADFKFVNDTGTYILIETIVDNKNTLLTFNFYGTKTNREVKLVGPEVTNVKPHPPTKYQDDPTLPKGTVKQVDFAVDGEDVTVFRDIYVNGQLVKHEKFFSRYAPWQAVYMRGTRVVQ